MKITPELIRKYLNNACTPDEMEAVDAWYKSFEQDADPLRLMNDAEQDNLRRSLYSRFKNSVASKDQPRNRSFFHNKLYTLLCAATGVAALVLLVVKVGITDQPASTITATNENVEIAFRNASYSIYKKVLPDQSTVWLSPNSTITYPKNFKGRYRMVKLTGEAFFEVTKNTAHPFIISSRELTTKVWGTSFRVRAFQNSPAEVSVVTGKVSVNQNNSRQEVMLLPNQKVTLLNHRQLVKDGSLATKSEMRIWKKVSLSFDNVKIRDVFTALNKNFDTNIYSNDTSLNNFDFTGDVTDQSLPAILDMIKESINASYSIEKGKAFVFKTNTSL